MPLILDLYCEHEPWHVLLPQVEVTVRRVCEAALEGAGFLAQMQDAEMSVMLLDDEGVRHYNKQYRNQDKATNVLSFPTEEWQAGIYPKLPPYVLLGDILLALETIQREADEQHKQFSDHFSHMLVHGTLHLIGYDHMADTEAEIMEALERRILEGLGVADPYEVGE